MLLKILSIFIALTCAQGQLVFPSESDIDNIAQNIGDYRGTSIYEQYVDRILSRGVTKLTLAVDKSLISKNKNYDHIVFAPVSIAAALALVLLGSNGKTFDEITTLMGLATGVEIQRKSQLVHEQFGRIIKKLEGETGFKIGHEVNFAAGIFVQTGYPIRRVYKEVAEKAYQSEILSLDFQNDPHRAQKTVNTWVNDRTKGKIKDLLQELPDPDTKVIIASAMHFSALWEYPFSKDVIIRKPFYVNGRDQKSEEMVDYMVNEGDFPYYKDLQLNCEILGLPYKGNQTTMYVVMPLNSSQEALKHLQNQLTPDNLHRLADSTAIKELAIMFPKMKLESTISLKETLRKLGLKSLFDEAQANLALLSPGKSGVNQTNPEVNERLAKDVVIFSRLKETSCNDTKGCPTGITNSIEPQHNESAIPSFSSRIGSMSETLDSIRDYINHQPDAQHFQNPGLFATEVIHKVYMNIMETGTEAAAATGVLFSRSGKPNFRAEVPFFFFIRHESTKTILFWGSVVRPTPHYKSAA